MSSADCPCCAELVVDAEPKLVLGAVLDEVDPYADCAELVLPIGAVPKLDLGGAELVFELVS